MSYNKQLPVVWECFTDIAAIQNMGVLQQMWLYEIIGGMLLMCQNTTMQVYGAMVHGLKLIVFYVQKHITVLARCPNPALVRDKPLGAPVSVKLVYCNPSQVSFLPVWYRLCCGAFSWSQSLTPGLGSIQFRNWNFSLIPITELELELKLVELKIKLE